MAAMHGVDTEIKIAKDPEELKRVAAEYFTAWAQGAVDHHGTCSVALSGGSTPKALYNFLANSSHHFRKSIPWAETHFFWGDERHVPADDPENNYRMALEAMLSKAPVPPGNIHRIPTEISDADQAAESYEQTIRGHFKLKSSQLPRFDIVLLGLGMDGHTASLFPDSEALREKSKLVCACRIGSLKTHRITLTLPVINYAEHILFMVSGKDKADIVSAVFAGEEGSEPKPAQLVQPEHGELIWLIDRQAAALLPAQDQPSDR